MIVFRDQIRAWINPPPTQDPLVEVPRAGETLREFQMIPRSAIDLSQKLRKTQIPKGWSLDVNKIEGRIPRRPIQKGEHFQEDLFFPVGAPELQPGWMIVALVQNNVSGPLRLLIAGSQVAILTTGNPPAVLCQKAVIMQPPEPQADGKLTEFLVQAPAAEAVRLTSLPVNTPLQILLRSGDDLPVPVQPPETGSKPESPVLAPPPPPAQPRKIEILRGTKSSIVDVPGSGGISVPPPKTNGDEPKEDE